MRTMLISASLTALIAASGAFAQSGTTAPGTAAPGTTAPGTAAAPASGTTAGTPAPAPAQVVRGPDLTRASRIIDQNVYSSTGERIGDIEDIVFDNAGQAQQVVVGVGGFLGMGEKQVAIPFKGLRIENIPASPARPGEPAPGTAATPGGAVTAMPAPTAGVEVVRTRFVVDMTRDQLRAAPEFRTDRSPRAERAPAPATGTPTR